MVSRPTLVATGLLAVSAMAGAGCTQPDAATPASPALASGPGPTAEPRELTDAERVRLLARFEAFVDRRVDEKRAQLESEGVPPAEVTRHLEMMRNAMMTAVADGVPESVAVMTLLRGLQARVAATRREMLDRGFAPDQVEGALGVLSREIEAGIERNRSRK